MQIVFPGFLLELCVWLIQSLFSPFLVEVELLVVIVSIPVEEKAAEPMEVIEGVAAAAQNLPENYQVRITIICQVLIFSLGFCFI